MRNENEKHKWNGGNYTASEIISFYIFRGIQEKKGRLIRI